MERNAADVRHKALINLHGHNAGIQSVNLKKLAAN